jgi:uncharacterized membrane-anchored protein
MSIVHSSLNHPLRVPLSAEVHSRPSLRLVAPETLTHLAVYACEDANANSANAAIQHAILVDLCTHFGVAGPGPDARYFFHDFARFRLQWECHTEFATYTFAAAHEDCLPLDKAFGRMPLLHVPQKWLHALEGKIMVAAHLVLETIAPADGLQVAQMRHMFDGKVLVGCEALEAGRAWTDFAIQADGFNRIVVQDLGMHYQQAGRLVQRLLEIETYRMMALLGLPHAQRAAPILNLIESDLAKLMASMTDNADANAMVQDADSELALLRNITGLAARIEKLALDNSYRFSASKAYFGLVQSRISELRESRIEGMPTVAEFMDRRLAPAMSTCESIARRQESLAERIAHTNDLLRTRVGIVQEQQNRKILESLNTRAAQQLRMQQAVEGLSVVAISYYSVGLLNYLVKALKIIGLPINAELTIGIMIPVMAGGVWWGLRQMHKRVSTGN